MHCDQQPSNAAPTPAAAPAPTPAPAPASAANARGTCTCANASCSAANASGTSGTSGSSSSKPASKHANVLEATEFQRSGLAAAAVDAHEGVLAEFAAGGAAQLLHKGEWFLLDEGAVARSIETVAIVAVLIATMGFTGFLSPPGGWSTTSDNITALALATNSTVSSAFGVFVVSNTLALAASLSLVLVIAVGSSFGLKAQAMLLVLYCSFGLLALAVLAALVAAGGAAFIVTPDPGLRRGLVAILCMAVVLALVVLAVLVWVVQRKARQDAYEQRLATVHRVASHMLAVLRALNNSFVTWEGAAGAADLDRRLVGDPILARYYHAYTLVMLGTLIPLFHHYAHHVKDGGELHKAHALPSDPVKRIASIMHPWGLHFYWDLWLKTCQDLERQFPAHRDVGSWDVGVNEPVAGVIGGPAQGEQGPPGHTGITRGSWSSGVDPHVSDGYGGPPKPLTPAAAFKDLDAKASALVKLLVQSPCAAQKDLDEAVARFRGRSKDVFTAAKLGHMMPRTIRAAFLNYCTPKEGPPEQGPPSTTPEAGSSLAVTVGCSCRCRALPTIGQGC